MAVMINEKNLLTKIRTAEPSDVSAAFATEISSNRAVVGNLNSQYKYTQTYDGDNGNGGGTSIGSGSGLDKMANNKYIEKMASMAAVKSWPKRLVQDIKDAPPLNQLGLAGGAVFGLAKLKNYVSNNASNKHHAQLEERSLKALHNINKNLGHVVKGTI